MIRLSRSLRISTFAILPALCYAGTVYTTTNATPQNELVVFESSTSGALTYSTSIPTGGAGTGTGLGSDNAVQIGEEGRWLVTVNAGSNTVSLFDVTGATPKLVSVANSAGLTPNSIALAHNRFYVLNSGSPASVAGFNVTSRGLLEPIPGSVRFLSVPAPDAPQIGVSAEGFVFVTEKATNSIDVFTAANDGSLSPAVVQPSVGATPFGFVTDYRGRLIVTEAQGAAAGASTVSSYSISGAGTLRPISSAIPNGQTASCWIAITGNKQYIYVANTDSDDISEYRVAANGSLTLVSGAAGTVAPGSKPADLAFSNNDRFLYVLNGGLGTMTGWAAASDGSIAAVGTFGTLPTSVTGLAAQ